MKKRTFAEVDFSGGEEKAHSAQDNQKSELQGQPDNGKAKKRRKTTNKAAHKPSTKAQDEDETVILKPNQPVAAAHNARQQSTSSRAQLGQKLRFHVPTDPDFSPIAIPHPTDENKGVDWREWQSPKCRCLQCEAIRVAPLLRGCRVVVLLDIDNWGFEQLAKELRATVRLPSDCLFWCFYGTGFEAFHGVDLSSTDFAQYAEKQGVLGSTVLSALQTSEKLWFSPAGGHPQAADTAILRTVSLLRNMHVAVLTSDRELGQQALRQPRSTPLDGQPRRVGRVCPGGRAFPAVWGDFLAFYDKAVDGTMW